MDDRLRIVFAYPCDWMNHIQATPYSHEYTRSLDFVHLTPTILRSYWLRNQPRDYIFVCEIRCSYNHQYLAEFLEVILQWILSPQVRVKREGTLVSYTTRPDWRSTWTRRFAASLSDGCSIEDCVNPEVGRKLVNTWSQHSIRLKSAYLKVLLRAYPKAQSIQQSFLELTILSWLLV